MKSLPNILILLSALLLHLVVQVDGRSSASVVRRRHNQGHNDRHLSSEDSEDSEDSDSEDEDSQDNSQDEEDNQEENEDEDEDMDEDKEANQEYPEYEQDYQDAEQQQQQEDTSFAKTILGSTYTGNTSNYHLHYSSCANIRGDASEYRTSMHGYKYAYTAYLNFQSCENSYYNVFDSLYCNHNVSHVTRMDDYFQANNECVQDYCDACNSACYDDTDDTDDGSTGGSGYCNTKCIKQCAKYKQVTGGSMDYSGCTGPFTATDGYSYYHGPACSSSGNGKVAMSFFNDEDCEVAVGEKIQLVSTSTDDDASYDTTYPTSFDTLDFVKTICSADVENLYDASIHCYDKAQTAFAVGDNADYEGEEHHSQDQDDAWTDDMVDLSEASKICRKVLRQKNGEGLYNSRQKSRSSVGRMIGHALLTLGMMAGMVGLVAFLIVGYTYYVRHLTDVGGKTSGDTLTSGTSSVLDASSVGSGNGGDGTVDGNRTMDGTVSTAGSIMSMPIVWGRSRSGGNSNSSLRWSQSRLGEYA